ncbi:hypothetical protein IWQ60_005327 [Tieghemiomyces parasiticus]|uniref:Uncharacterized protein n=1 Tax=Tieghemiomyces parasiticus TaxID=78921 RepID=A0A9W8DUQ5_9FUNG|nr:hypothetical protein IWQ60_005327 [Tieghemiomyces parasiticus]
MKFPTTLLVTAPLLLANVLAMSESDIVDMEETFKKADDYAYSPSWFNLWSTKIPKGKALQVIPENVGDYQAGKYGEKRLWLIYAEGCKFSAKFLKEAWFLQLNKNDGAYAYGQVKCQLKDKGPNYDICKENSRSGYPTVLIRVKDGWDEVTPQDNGTFQQVLYSYLNSKEVLTGTPKD